MTGPPRGRGVLSVGRLYCDLVFSGLPALPRMGRETFAEGLSLHAGGGAAITAAHLVRLARPAALAAVLPASPFDAPVLADIAAAGIDAGLCTPAIGDEPQITVAMTGPDDRAFLTRRVGAAIPPLSVATLTGRGLVHMHIGELATLIEQPGLITLARAAGLTLSLDCSWDDRVGADAADLIRQVDVFLPNEAEAVHLAALGMPAQLAPLTVVKRGAKGATALAGHATTEAPTTAVDVVDTTGAGDAFNAGFLHCWLDGAPLAECLAMANACGAAAVQTKGGMVEATESAPVDRRAAAR